MPAADPRTRLATTNPDQIANWALALIRAASPNPPLDTQAAAETAHSIIAAAVPQAELALHRSAQGVVNLVARIHGRAPGSRIVFNGHLDTYPVGDPTAWSRDPAGQRDGTRLYGRGAADMKGGIAASIAAFAALAAERAHWPGEVVLTLAGDEESMGPLGTKFLLDNVPEATGHAVLIPDAGSPHVLRFGEKGFLWLEIESTGRAAHGAHVHLGDNAVQRLLEALQRLENLKSRPIQAPTNVLAAITRSQPISEPLAGAGEAETLRTLTINIGRIEGGTSTNLVPSTARAGVDIRLPVGLPTAPVRAALAAALDRPGITYRVTRCFEPNYTDPATPLVRTAAAAAHQVLGTEIAVNMRVGGSDARWFRLANLPTIVYGPAPHNMGAPDEWVDLDELSQVARVFALTAFALLTDFPNDA